jgi:hypothetical protein
LNNIGPYQVVDLLYAFGGQGHLIHARRGGRDYLLKQLIAGDDDEVAHERFSREAWFLDAIDHENIVKLVEFAEYEGRRYIVMEKLPGHTLYEEMRGGRRIDPDRVLRIARQYLTALTVLHGYGIAYRDGKPDNVQVYPKNNDHTWLLDLGYACFVGDNKRLTKPGGPIPGVDGYRAPEQLSGGVYVQSDVFTVGVIMYEAISGVHPFGRSDDRVRSGKYTPLRRRVPSLPSYIEFAVDQMLAPKITKRPSASKALALLDDPARGLRVLNRERAAWLDRSRLPSLFRVTAASAPGTLAAVGDGAVPDALVVSATDAVAIRAAREMSAATNTPLLVDPTLERSAFVGFTRGSAPLAYEPADGDPYTLEDLETGEDLRTLARMALVVEAECGATLPMIPGFLTTDVSGDGWLGCNSQLLDVAVAAIDSEQPFIVRVSTSLEAIPTTRARTQLVEALGRHSPDAYLLSIDGLAPAADGEQLLRALELCTDLERGGGRVVMSGVGGLEPFFSAFGIGCEVELLSDPPFSARPSTSYRKPRFAFPSLLGSLNLSDAKTLLERGRIAEARCRCAACRRSTSVDERLMNAVEHNAAATVRQRALFHTHPSQDRIPILRAEIEIALRLEAQEQVGEWRRRVERLTHLDMAVSSAAERLARLAA